jgi:hypothetical protein
MTGSRDTLPAPSLPNEPRHALVLATTDYADQGLRQLRSPARDALDLAAVLADDEIGGFDVTKMLDGTAHEIRVELESFLSDRATDDLVLVYLSCHGLVDARRRLYFAGTDTTKSRLAATGVESRWLLEQMEDCRARRQILILDCCFSGAFALNAKGENDLELGDRLAGHSRGRVVLTASRATEYSFEGEPIAGAASGSVFTTALLDGLRTGAADANNDGFVSVEEAYDYAFQKVRAAGASQTPQRWVYGAEGGSIVLARSAAGVTVGAAELPNALRDALDNPFPDVRAGAVRALGEWLGSPDLSKVMAARRRLYQITDNDIGRVAAVARELLNAQQRLASQPSGALARPAPTPRRPAARVRPESNAAETVERAPAIAPGFEHPPTQAPEEYADEQPYTVIGLDEELEELGYQPLEISPLPPRRFTPREDDPSALVARYLFPTERFRGEWRLHWMYVVKRVVYAAAAAALGLIQPGFKYLPSKVDAGVAKVAIKVVCAAAALYLLWRAATWSWRRLVLTNKRVMVVAGLLHRRVSMLPLLRVTDMKYVQSWLGRLLNYGTFLVESAGRTDQMRRIRNVPHPNELYLRIVEEMYEPAAVEARLGYVHEDDE